MESSLSYIIYSSVLIFTHKTNGLFISDIS